MLANLWSQFAGLFGTNATEVVLVVQHNGDGTSTVEFPGSGGRRARKIGTGVAVGEHAYIDDAGRIVGEAPSLPYGEDEI